MKLLGSAWYICILETNKNVLWLKSVRKFFFFFVQIYTRFQWSRYKKIKEGGDETRDKMNTGGWMN